MIPEDGHIMMVAKRYPTGACLLTCPDCGLTMTKDLVSGAFVVLDFGPKGCVPINHYFAPFPHREVIADEMDVWRQALEDIEL